MAGCGCPCGMCAQGHCDKCWGRGPHVASTCTRHLQPGAHMLVDGDGGHVFCDLCVIQLLADMQRVGTHLVFSVEAGLEVAA